MQMLAQVDVERVSPTMSATQKVEHFVKITMLYLEDENAVDAERFFVKVRAGHADFCAEKHLQVCHVSNISCCALLVQLQSSLAFQ